MAEKSQSLEFPATDLIERALHARPRRLRAERSGTSPYWSAMTAAPDLIWSQAYKAFT